MAQKSQGSQQGARKKLRRSPREKTTVNEMLKEFEEGEKAIIKIDSSVQEGSPHTRFYGKTVDVIGRRGDAYEVEFTDGGKTKQLQVHPAHLQKVNE